MAQMKNGVASLIHLDPRTKFFMLLMAMGAYLQVLPLPITFAYIGLGILLIILSGYPKVAGNYSLLYLVISSIVWLSDYLPNWVAAILGVLTMTIQFFLPILVYMMLLVYTSSIEDVALILDKLRAPAALSIPILVMMRFIPTIGDEYRHIRSAMVFRGIELGPKNMVRHPVKTVEYIYVPLLFSLVRIGEELTMSSLTRGLGLNKKRTRMHDQRLRWIDYALLLVYLLIFCIGIYWKGAKG